MARALRQYGSWLRDNYADLEHKEVWQSFMVLVIILLLLVFYAFFIEGPVYQYALLVVCAVLICYLPWRVETLSDLSVPAQQDTDIVVDDATVEPDGFEGAKNDATMSICNAIESKLKMYCEDPQLYLQHDITATQLAARIGVNRYYLSRHFTSHGTTYNAYINGLRIRHFVNLYQEAIANYKTVTAQKLAYQSGFRSYSTFSAAFKQFMGMNVTEWMTNNS